MFWASCILFSSVLTKFHQVVWSSLRFGFEDQIGSTDFGGGVLCRMFGNSLKLLHFIVVLPTQVAKYANNAVSQPVVGQSPGFYNHQEMWSLSSKFNIYDNDTHLFKQQVIGKDADIDHRATNIHNKTIYTNNRIVTNEAIRLHPRTISSRGILGDGTASIQDCCNTVPTSMKEGML